MIVAEFPEREVQLKDEDNSFQCASLLYSRRPSQLPLGPETSMLCWATGISSDDWSCAAGWIHGYRTRCSEIVEELIIVTCQMPTRVVWLWTVSNQPLGARHGWPISSTVGYPSRLLSTSQAAGAGQRPKSGDLRRGASGRGLYLGNRAGRLDGRIIIRSVSRSGGRGEGRGE